LLSQDACGRSFAPLLKNEGDCEVLQSERTGRPGIKASSALLRNQSGEKTIRVVRVSLVLGLQFDTLDAGRLCPVIVNRQLAWIATLGGLFSRR
jgi:hypothetical protein